MKKHLLPIQAVTNDIQESSETIKNELNNILNTTWIYKPMRDFYRKICKLSGKDFFGEGYQPYALMKHKCGHRTISTISSNRKLMSRESIIKSLKISRLIPCNYCYQQEKEEYHDKKIEDLKEQAFIKADGKRKKRKDYIYFTSSKSY